ncbi:MAG TPA: chaperone modulator CbpM [Chitinophagaceae bacterium]|nr:chaperone modulator CbpM [Chitinophagaceae bacterium]
MQAQLIAANTFCAHYHAEVSFIHSLHESGLIELITVDETEFIQEDDLQKLERLTRLHYELQINTAGIETIVHLLDKLEIMQQEIAGLRNRLGLYEIL